EAGIAIDIDYGVTFHTRRRLNCFVSPLASRVQTCLSRIVASDEAEAEGSETTIVEMEGVTGTTGDRRSEGARKNDLPRLETLAVHMKFIGEPCYTIRRMIQNGCGDT